MSLIKCLYVVRVRERERREAVQSRCCGSRAGSRVGSEAQESGLGARVLVQVGSSRRGLVVEIQYVINSSRNVFAICYIYNVSSVVDRYSLDYVLNPLPRVPPVRKHGTFFNFFKKLGDPSDYKNMP